MNEFLNAKFHERLKCVCEEELHDILFGFQTSTKNEYKYYPILSSYLNYVIKMEFIANGFAIGFEELARIFESKCS